MRLAGLWLGRLLLLVGLIACATLAVAFGIVTYLEISERTGTPMVVLTALLVPICLALGAACWWLFASTFEDRGEPGPGV